MANKRPRYSDEFRATAIAALFAEGYPDKPGALSKVSKAFNLHVKTLSRWASGENNPPFDNDVNRKKIELADLLETEIYAVVDLLPEKRTRASYSQLTMALAVLIDKMRLLRGLPTEIVQMLPDLVQAIERHGMKPSDIFHAMLERLNAEAVRANPE